MRVIPEKIVTKNCSFKTIQQENIFLSVKNETGKYLLLNSSSRTTFNN